MDRYDKIGMKVLVAMGILIGVAFGFGLGYLHPKEPIIQYKYTEPTNFYRMNWKQDEDGLRIVVVEIKTGEEAILWTFPNEDCVENHGELPFGLVDGELEGGQDG